MPVFKWTANGNQGIEYNGNYPIKYQQAFNNLYAGNAYVSSETLLSNGGLSYYVNPGFEIDITYKNFQYNAQTGLITYQGADISVKEYGNVIATATNECSAYIYAGSTTGTGYQTYETTFYHETNIREEITGIINLTGIGSNLYNNYLIYVKGDDTFHGTKNDDILDSGKGNDVIYGNKGNDQIKGGDGSDIIQGGEGNDNIDGGNGGDSITPGKGNDVVEGGSGVDEIWFSGKSSDYQFSGSSSSLTVKDIGSGFNDGTDILKNIENLRFTDGLLTTSQALNLLPNKAPTSWVISSTSFDENIPDGSTIATFSAIDENLTDTHTFTLVDGYIESSGNKFFNIEGNKLKIINSPDYETKNSYTIVLKTTDQGGLSSPDLYIELSVNDLNEGSNPNSATSRELQQLYIAYFSRPSDPAGLDYWTNEGISRSDFAANMYLQPEFNNVNGGLTIEAQVNQIYLNLFNREADVTGLTYWAQQIRNGALQLASIANDLIWAAENNPGGSTDASILANKTNAAVAYTAQIRTSTSSILNYQAQSTNPWITGFNLTEAKNYISEIGQYNTHTSSSIDNSIAKFISLSSSSNLKLLVDPTQSKIDSITGLETNIEITNSLEVTSSETNSITSNITNNYLLLDITNQEFVSHLYSEVLNREPDSIGMNYWLGQLNSGAETKHEVFLGFSESIENNTLFTDMTGFA